MKAAIMLLAMSLLLVACSQGPTGGVTMDVGKDNAEQKVTVQSDEGKIEMTGHEGSGDWCDEGADWSWIASGQDSTQARWTVEGIETSGKYAGLCHIHYEVESTDGNMVWDYYIGEDQGSGYMDMTLPNGQKYSQEWSK